MFNQTKLTFISGRKILAHRFSVIFLKQFFFVLLFCFNEFINIHSFKLRLNINQKFSQFEFIIKGYIS